MQTIATDVYIENGYPGATLGVINLPHGLVQVDAPPSPEDGRAWRAALMNLGGGSERLLVNLDAHPDRTLGARAMDCTIVAQEKTAHVFRTRPTTFKAQGEETGSDWESIPGLGEYPLGATRDHLQHPDDHKLGRFACRAGTPSGSHRRVRLGHPAGCEGRFCW